MLEQNFEGQQLQLSVSHKIFPLPVIERTLFLLRDLITSVEVTENSSEKIGMYISIAEGGPEDIEDIFYSRLISTAVSFVHDENSEKIKNYFIQTAMAATTNSQRALKRHLVLQAQRGFQPPENRGAYWQNYKGYRVELGSGFDIFVEEKAGVFHLDLDDKVYSLTYIQPVVDKIASDRFQYKILAENSRVIVSIKFQKAMTRRGMLKALLDLQKDLRMLSNG